MPQKLPGISGKDAVKAFSRDGLPFLKKQTAGWTGAEREDHTQINRNGPGTQVFPAKLQKN
ncbi:MAG: hypothetical protein PHQ34_06530 [Methanothrix sp.]|nr:hypothetical protein [Methanothrix sp.]